MSDQVQKTMSNTDANTRRWDSLQRMDDRIDADGKVSAAAGSTLELDPGEKAVVMVPADFEDPWLKEARVGAPKKDAPKRESGTSETQKEG